MKRRFTYYVLLIIMSLLLLSCGKKGSSPTSPTSPETPTEGTYKLYGKVMSDNKPVAGANIQLGSAINWKTTTDADGVFSITNAIKGELDLVIQKTLDNNKVIGQRTKIALVTDSTNMGTINLPAPLDLISVDNSQLSKGIITPTWSKYSGDDFVCYRVYRKDIATVDMDTGELVFSSDDSNTTQCDDNSFKTGINCYYRVYVISSNNKYSASNIISTTIPEINLLNNSGFELSSDGVKPDTWIETISGLPTFHYFEICTDQVHSGNNALKISFDEANANPPEGKYAWGGLYQSFTTAKDLVCGREYTLSFWGKSVVGSFQIRISRDGNLDDNIISYTIPSGKDWSEEKFTFKVESSVSYVEVWITTKPSNAVGGQVLAYIDDIKIIK